MIGIDNGRKGGRRRFGRWSWSNGIGILALCALILICLSQIQTTLAEDSNVVVQNPIYEDETSAPTSPTPPSPNPSSKSMTADEAYDRAIRLLRSTLANQKASSVRGRKETKSSKSKQADKKRSQPVSAHQKRLNGISLYWELFKNWLPFTGIFRDLIRLRDMLITLIPFPGAGNQAAAGQGHRSPVNLAAAMRGGSGMGWEGGNILAPPEAYVAGKDPGEEEQARTFPGARPQQLWPEWDGGDDAYFGPFLSSSEEEQQAEQNGNSQTSSNKNTSMGWDKLSMPGSSSRKKREAEQRQWHDRWREEAIALLTWASGWGDAHLADDRDLLIKQASVIDWSTESSIFSSQNLGEQSIESFLQSKNRLTTVNQTRPNPDALWTLAMHSFWGTHGALPHPLRAKACLERLVSMNGNASAHNYLGWMEGGAWGREGWRLLGVEDKRLVEEVEDRQSKALLHYTAAAKSGDTLAQTTLAYRHNAGIGVKPNCGSTLYWYEKAATDALRRYQSGPPGGLTLPYTHLRLSDLSGGVFGPGASAASTGWAKHRPAIQAMLNRLPSDGSSDGRRLEDLLEFFTYHAQRGDPSYALKLAQIYYGGSVLGASESAARVPRDYKKARDYLMRIVRDVWPLDAQMVAKGGPTGPLAKQGERGEDVKLNVDDTHALLAGTAASLLGRMWLRGEGVPPSHVRAWVWFSRGAEQGSSESQNGLGLMYQLGLGVPKNWKKATEYFEASCSAGIMSSIGGCVNLGKIHFQLREYTQAAKFFDLAMKLGNSFESYYYLALINVRMGRLKIDPSDPNAYVIDAPGTASHDRCRNAVNGFKYAIERGDWKDPTFSRAERAWGKGMRGRALLGWSIAGERGYEAAQNNLAWVLDRDKKRLKISAFDIPQNNSTDRLALIHWIRSAAQDNVDALVKMGDYYYYGIGSSLPAEERLLNLDHVDEPESSTDEDTPTATSGIATIPSVSYDKAAACYSAAAEKQTSALAYWNMGFMYERGLGVPKKDYNLAKRYYDMALELNKEAYLPVLLSLAKLFMMACWDAFTNKDATALNLLNGLAFGPTGRSRVLGAMSGGFFDNGEMPYTEADEIRFQHERHEAAGQAVNGGAAPGAEMGDHNLPEFYDNGPAAAGGGGGSGHNVAQGGGSATTNAHGTENLDGTIEGLMIVFGLAALAMLVYVRQGVQLRLERQRREEAAARAADAAGDGSGSAEDQRRRQEAAQAVQGGPPVVDPNQPFGWPLQDGNAYAGL